MGERFVWRINEGEYEEFVRWYYGAYAKAKKVRPGKMDFHDLREETEFVMEAEYLLIKSGNRAVYLLYRAIGEIYETEHLIVFFDMMAFQAVPKRVFRDKERLESWRRQLEARRRRAGDERVPFSLLEEEAKQEGRLVGRYVRTVEEVKEEYRLLGRRKKAMEQMRKPGIFPYRLIGEQMVLWGRDGILECSEQAVVLHRYEGIKCAKTGNGTLLLEENDAASILIPLDAVGDAAGANGFVRELNLRRRAGSQSITLKQKKVPFRAKWEIPKSPALIGVLSVVCLVTVALVLWKGHFTGFYENRASGGGGEKQEAEAVTGDMGMLAVEPLMVTIPDDTQFDLRQEDGTFVSSGLFYSMNLPAGEWTWNVGGINYMDYFRSDWATVMVSSGETGKAAGYDIRDGIPETKEEYKKNFGQEGSEIVEYSLGESGSYTVVRREIRWGGAGTEKTNAGISIELGVFGETDYYNLVISLKDESEMHVEMARKMRESFRLVDTRAGIGRELKEAVFQGYYGKNVYMTSCLVLMEREMTREEIEAGLVKVKELPDTGSFFHVSCDALAARTKDSKWLGIDCGSLQQNCRKSMAKAVAKIFQSEVVLYDEFDGDLLMAAYSSADGKRAYERATAGDWLILESEFKCYGKEQEFPEDLLKYMDLTAEEAEAVWKSEDYIFQMDKWIEIMSHMTKTPVPEEFVGLYDIKALDENFEIIKK